MRRSRPNLLAPQRGIVLVASLLLLLVVTIFAISMFRSYGIEERIAGNVRDKERARHAALAAMQYAEWWLSQPDSGLGLALCNTLLNANTGGTTACGIPNSAQIVTLRNKLGAVNPSTVPWIAGGQEIGTTYQPPNMNITNPALPDYYAAPPRFYISYLGRSPLCPASGGGNVYQIDAWGYGSSTASVAVIESIYQVVFPAC